MDGDAGGWAPDMKICYDAVQLAVVLLVQQLFTLRISQLLAFKLRQPFYLSPPAAPPPPSPPPSPPPAVPPAPHITLITSHHLSLLESSTQPTPHSHGPSSPETEYYHATLWAAPSPAQNLANWSSWDIFLKSVHTPGVVVAQLPS